MRGDSRSNDLVIRMVKFNKYIYDHKVKITLLYFHHPLNVLNMII